MEERPYSPLGLCSAQRVLRYWQAAISGRCASAPPTHEIDAAERDPFASTLHQEAAARLRGIDGMKLCIVSDSHDRAPMLAAAVAAGQRAGAQAVLHCGDLIGAMTLRPLLGLGLPVHLVHGNNLGDAQALWGLCRESGGLVTYHGADATLQLGGRSLFATHLPHYALGVACTGDYDIVCCGHLHEASIARQANVKGGTTWLLNPGTVAALGAPATWMLADLAQMTFEIRDVPG